MKRRIEFLELVKKKLLKRKIEMTEELNALSHEKVSDGQVQDSAGLAMSSTLDKVNSSLGQTDIGELKLIDEALSRLDHGEYGICIDCGEAISSKRLETFPYAARCIVCQEAIDE